MLKLSEVSHNHHPSGVKLLANFIRRRIWVIVITITISSCASNYQPTPQVQPEIPQKIIPNIVLPTKTIIPTSTKVPSVSMGTVLVKNLNIRSGPGVVYGIVGSMKQGEKFQILGDVKNLDANQKWLVISMANNSFGFVIGEPNYISEKLEIVDYLTYTSWLDKIRLAKLIYDNSPTKISTSKPVPSPTMIRFSPPSATAYHPNSILDCRDTINHINKIVTCRISKAYCSYFPSTSGSPTFCNDGPYPNYSFTLVVWGSDWSGFNNNCILVHGLVTLFHGKPQVEAVNISQVSFCQN